MPKNIEDMVPRKKTIRDIPIPENRKSTKTSKSELKDIKKGSEEVHIKKITTPKRAMAPKRSRRPRISPRPRKSWGKKTWIGLGVVALALLFILMTIFNGATLAYVPKTVELNLASEVYSAKKTGTTGLIYSVVKLSGEKGVEVTASGEEEVARKASGTIVIYNNSGTAPQRLVENTRFESSDGKVYRIASPVSVPGKSSNGPGSIEATVYADEPGQAYNIGLSDFTLPGLKGSDKFTTVYARSKTPMSGGFVGTEKVVSEDSLATAKESLRAEIKNALVEEARAQVPEDFVLFPSLSTVDYEDLPQTGSGGDSVTINMRGHLYGVIFKRSDLSRYISTRKTLVASGESVDIENLESLDIRFAGTPPTDLLSSNEISFEVTGNASVVWLTDETALKSDLRGKEKSEVSSVLTNYPSILSASTVVRPFWKSSFPDDITRITLKRERAK